MPSSPALSHDDTLAISQSNSQTTGHTTCPPDEERLANATSDATRLADSLSNVTMDQPDSRRPSLQDADVESGGESEGAEEGSKKINDVDAVLIRDTPSPLIAQGVRKEESQHYPVQPDPSSPSLLPQQLPLPSSPSRVYPNSTSSYLRPGSKFVGTQQSDRQVYHVQVEIKYVDMEESFLCGYLRIQGLTDDHPTLTTYFEGEIIGNKHTFRTAHSEWGSSEKVDMQHWARFPAWRPLAKQAKSPGFTFKNFAQREHLFMRWKEYFLVPDHKVKTITGASFEGFYYICFNQCAGSVSGIYFHAKSEKYQQLELEHVNDRGCIGAMEFR